MSLADSHSGASHSRVDLPGVHLSNDLLVRAMDEELTGSEALAVATHLALCAECGMRQTELRRVSDGFDLFLRSVQPVAPNALERETAQGKDELRHRLGAFQAKKPVSSTGRTLVRFGWVMAAAATLALGVSYLPFDRFVPQRSGSATMLVSSRETVGTRPVASTVGSPFEIDGETFQYLPYSNPDLPLGGSHVVQMQVPLSSLADAGLLVEPIATRIATPDRAVLADVLLGMDGQPIGVHVLSAD